MEFGIKEYWIINPKLKTVEIYTLEKGEYKQAAIYKSNDCTVSQIFGELQIHLEEVFLNNSLIQTIKKKCLGKTAKSPKHFKKS